jgi:AbrB family looped-hinge helix DNA binding protein
MPTLSAKRQVTIPKELCDRLHVEPGDDLEFLEFQGNITIIKKQDGASKGLLSHLARGSTMSDDDSLESAIETENAPVKRVMADQSSTRKRRSA